MYGQSADQALLVMGMQSVGLPLICSLLGLAVSHWMLARDRQQAAQLLLALGVGLGFWLAAAWIRNRWGLPPQQAMDVLATAPLWLLVGELGWQQRLRGAQWGLPLGLLLLALSWLLWPVLSRREFWLAAALVLALVGVTWLIAGFVRGAGRVAESAFWFGAAALAAPLIALDGSLLLALLGGALATALGVLWLAGLLPRLATASLRLLPAAMVLLLYSSAHFYANVDPLALALPLAGLLLGVVSERVRPSDAGWLISARLVFFGGAATALAVWRVWPEGPMY